MKGFKRENRLLSLCGLNCGLCTMYLGKYCPGCGGGEGNQPCAIARCSLQHPGVEYCWQCHSFPCEKYEGIDEYDSFITHRNRLEDMKRAETIGVEHYNEEQTEKSRHLEILLENYNDGRKKTLYCQAVNLLKLQDIRDVMKTLEGEDREGLFIKEKAKRAESLFLEKAGEREIELKLRRKPKK
ncbi:MAG: DUF3795 domain-containing protein [Clostridia bacterium]|nr:DUF3795 domain-containing protein [Clostridia bacterium]